MRKIISILLSLILLVALTVPASAATACEFLLREYDVTSDTIFCYGKQLPKNGKLEVSVDNRILEGAYLSTLEQERLPVTVYCLVDSATSLSDKAVQRYKDALLTMSSLMDKEDSMVLATIDGQLTESKPMNTKDSRDAAINAISGSVWYTNLYDGISQALKSLQTSTTYNTNRCLVILSDGHDDGKSIAKSDAVLKQIQETGIPVYSVVLSSASITAKEKDLHTEFTEESLGGSLYNLDKDNLSASAAAQQIWNSVKGSAVIRINAEELQGSDMDQELLIRYDTADTRYEDTILIRAVDLPVVETTPQGNPRMSRETLLACGIGAALLIIGIAAFFLLRKKPEESAAEAEFPVMEESISSEFTPEPENYFASTAPAAFASTPADERTRPVENRCHVTAIAIMHSKVAVDFYLTPNMQTTFGRTNKADIILNPNDAKLSGCHGCFLWDGKKLFVQDRNSTNGTAVNGERCTKNGWLQLEEGSVLTAGLYEYRITFQAE